MHFQKSGQYPRGEISGRAWLEKLRHRKSAGLGGAWKFYCERRRGDRGGNAEVDRENSSDGSGKTWCRITNRSANRRGGSVMGIQLNAEFWGAQAASLQCSAACRAHLQLLDQRNISAGKLPAAAGWQPALPRKL